MSNLEALVDSVLVYDDSRSREDILLDLEYTNNVQTTINRIFDGKFLEGVQRKPKDTMIILDSDEEEEHRSELRSPENDYDFLDDSGLEQKDRIDLDSSAPKDPFEFPDATPPPPPRKKVFDFSTISKKNNVSSPPQTKQSSPPRFLDNTENDEFDFLDDSPPIPSPTTHILDEEDDYMSEPSSKICVSPIRRVSLDSLEELSPIRYTNRSETPPPKISLDSSPIRDKPSRRESFSNQSKSIFSDDEEDSFLDKLSLKPSSISRKRKASPSNINLIDSDSDGSLPSVNDFFDQLMSQKEDRKGKGRAYSPAQSRSEAMSECSSVNDEMPDLSAKEQRRLDAEERKRTQMQEKLRAAEERKQLAEEKKRKREELLEEKKLAKERKILEKERNAIFEKENRIKSNRVETIKEMIVEMHPDFVETKAGELLKMVLEKKETTIREGNRGPYHLLWKRICTSEWDEDTLAFIPYKEPKVITEPFVLVYVDIYELFKHIQADTTDDYVDHIKSATEPDHQIFLLVEGLQAYYRKKINLERRIFDEQIRSTIDGASTSASRRKIQPEIENGPSHKQVEEAVNYLILKKDIMFVMTKSDEDTVSWIESLTTDLALGRYKNKNLNSAYKSRKACSDPTENYSKILQEIQLCTQAVATSVMNEYPTLQSLHRAYTRESKVTGEQLLADLDVERSALSARDRKVNRSMSKKIYRIFSTDDPNEVVN